MQLFLCDDDRKIRTDREKALYGFCGSDKSFEPCLKKNNLVDFKRKGVMESELKAITEMCVGVKIAVSLENGRMVWCKY